MAASPGFEPRLTESESAVLPLDDEAIATTTLFYVKTSALSTTFFLLYARKHKTYPKRNNRKFFVFLHFYRTRLISHYNI